ELLVVVGADEFGRIDRAVLERRVDVDMGDILRRHADPRQHRAAQPADAPAQAFEVVDGADLLLEPGAHLRARQTGRDAHDIEPLERTIDDFGAAAEGPPGLLLAAAQSERNTGAEAQRRVFGDIEIRRRVRAIDRAAADGVERLTAGRELAG